MRNELELMATIEQYLDGTLPAVEKAAFEARLAANPVLQEEVQGVREVRQGIDRALWQQQVQEAGKRYKKKRRLGVFIIVLLLLLGLFAWLWLKPARVVVETNKAAAPAAVITQVPAVVADSVMSPVLNNIPMRVPSVDRSVYAIPGLQTGNLLPDLFAEAPDGAYLEEQVFLLNAERDTVIETKGGMLLSVPAHSFLTGVAQPVEGEFQLLVKEALDAATIMQSGLASFSGDRLLESGGMFHLRATRDGKELQVDGSRALLVEVPADTIKPGMELFTGITTTDGKIDWVNPKQLLTDLVPVDILQLDFYPPGYLANVAKWRLDAHDKIFTDSLYFSAAACFGQIELPGDRVLPEKMLTDWEDPQGQMKELYPKGYKGKAQPMTCAIDPARIKTIWSDAYQHTLLATREFEARMPYIHESRNTAILDLYVSNLDKSISAIDMMAANLLSGGLRERFMAFAARQEGKTAGSSVVAARKLGEYYTRQSGIFRAAISKTYRDFNSGQEKQDSIARQKATVYNADSVRRAVRQLEEELALTMAEAYRQLGYSIQAAAPAAAANRRWAGGAGGWRRKGYTAAVTTGGWHNIDRYVSNAVVNRTTLEFTDNQSGKIAVVKYEPVIVSVSSVNDYDRMYVYLLPDKISGFIRLRNQLGAYRENINALIQYKLVCVGYKQEHAFVCINDQAAAGAYNIHLQPVSNDGLEKMLNNITGDSSAAELQRELLYLAFEAEEQKRRQRVLVIYNLRDELLPFIYPCWRYTAPRRRTKAYPF